MDTKMNTCPNAEQTIVGYIDGNLATADHITFERHMASCSVCRTIERELRMTQTLVRTLSSAEPRQDFEARLAVNPKFAADAHRIQSWRHDNNIDRASSNSVFAGFYCFQRVLQLNEKLAITVSILGLHRVTFDQCAHA